MDAGSLNQEDEKGYKNKDASATQRKLHEGKKKKCIADVGLLLKKIYRGHV